MDEGRVTLLGDAAHPMMPTLAQGGCMAIEDGWSIARCIADNAADIPRALATYEDERRPRTSRVQLQARQPIPQQQDGARAPAHFARMDLFMGCNDGAGLSGGVSLKKRAG